MKKALIFVGIILTVGIFAFIYQVQGVTSEPVTTETTLTSGTITFQENMYYYTDYQDLINQIYEDIYDDVYAQIQAEVINELTEAFYEEIYESVEAQLVDLLSAEELELYIDDFQQQLYAVIELAENSVFGITNYSANDEIAIGSGVVYRYDSSQDLYYMITNHHVIEDGLTYEIQFADETTVEATVIGFDTEVDIAIVTFSGAGLDFIEVSPLGDSDSNEVSEFLIAVGNPIGYNFYNSATLGIISGVEREVDTNNYIEYIQHDAAINGGNSGGPVYNLEGEVIGINVSKFANVEVEGMGFAIPINMVKRIIERIEAGTLTVNTIMPRIGCSYYAVDERIEEGEVFLDRLTVNGSDKLNLTIPLPEGITDGIIINEISTLGTLDGILKSGDLIIEINGYMIEGEKGFQDYLYENFEAGDHITIYYYEFDQANYDYSETISQVSVKLK
ncbi:MAG: serine protease [Tenericutes bacterium]|nr:serine protease [Mycoplasmatota bacterium]